MNQFVGVCIGIVCIIGVCQVSAFFDAEEEGDVDQVNNVEAMIHQLTKTAFQFDKDNNSALDKSELNEFFTFLTGKADEVKKEESTKKSGGGYFESYEEIFDDEEEGENDHHEL